MVREVACILTTNHFQMRTRGERVRKFEKFADVIDGCPLELSSVRFVARARVAFIWLTDLPPPTIWPCENMQGKTSAASPSRFFIHKNGHKIGILLPEIGNPVTELNDDYEGRKAEGSTQVVYGKGV